jgi:hypothetical protein
MALPSPLSILTPIASLSAKRTRATGYREAISSYGTEPEVFKPSDSMPGFWGEADRILMCGDFRQSTALDPEQTPIRCTCCTAKSAIPSGDPAQHAGCR